MIQSRRKLALSEKDLSSSFRDHQILVREICGRDKAGARAAMSQHLDRVYHSWEETQRPKLSVEGRRGKGSLIRG